MLDTVSTDVVENSNSALMQELHEIAEVLRIHRRKHTKYKILQDAIEESVGDLDYELKNKVQDILLSHSCAELLMIETESITSDSRKLLGISHINQTELNYNESRILINHVERYLQQKYKDIYKHVVKMTNGNEDDSLPSSDSLDFNLISEDQDLLALRRKLMVQQKQYLHNLIEEQEILEKFSKLRLENLPKILDEKVKECELNSTMNSLRTKILQEKTRIDIFMETNYSFHAYQEIIKDIKKQQEECLSEIDRLKRLKNKYNQVACKQFDGILKLYVQYKTALEKKKLIYDSLIN